MSITFDAELLSAGGLTAVPAPPVIDITLSRPSALNALLPATFHGLHHVLDRLSTHDAPLYLVLRASGRAFSAGGDVRSLRAEILAHAPRSAARRAAARAVLATEYDLLARWAALDRHHRLTVAVGEGLALGAGAGLFQACAVRLVGPRFFMAMPEARIGIIPDCGATRFYARLPGCVGMYLALTGARVHARDALALGLADGAIKDGWQAHGLADGEFGPARVLKGGEEEALLGEMGEIAQASSAMRRGVDEVFSAAEVDEVLERLQAREGEWAKEALKALKAGAPKAIKETFRVMRMAYEARGEGVREAMDRELEVESQLCAAPDFEEGVRAALVDKDGKPKWESI